MTDKSELIHYCLVQKLEETKTTITELLTQEGVWAYGPPQALDALVESIDYTLSGEEVADILRGEP